MIICPEFSIHIRVELLYGITEQVFFHSEVECLIFLDEGIELLEILAYEPECPAEFCFSRIWAVLKFKWLLRGDALTCEHGCAERIELRARPCYTRASDQGFAEEIDVLFWLDNSKIFCLEV